MNPKVYTRLIATVLAKDTVPKGFIHLEDFPEQYTELQAYAIYFDEEKTLPELRKAYSSNETSASDFDRQYSSNKVGVISFFIKKHKTTFAAELLNNFGSESSLLEAFGYKSNSLYFLDLDLQLADGSDISGVVEEIIGKDKSTDSVSEPVLSVDHTEVNVSVDFKETIGAHRGYKEQDEVKVENEASIENPSEKVVAEETLPTLVVAEQTVPDTVLEQEKVSTSEGDSLSPVDSPLVQINKPAETIKPETAEESLPEVTPETKPVNEPAEVITESEKKGDRVDEPAVIEVDSTESKVSEHAGAEIVTPVSQDSEASVIQPETNTTNGSPSLPVTNSYLGDSSSYDESNGILVTDNGNPANYEGILEYKEPNTMSTVVNLPNSKNSLSSEVQGTSDSLDHQATRMLDAMQSISLLAQEAPMFLENLGELSKLFSPVKRISQDDIIDQDSFDKIVKYLKQSEEQMLKQVLLATIRRMWRDKKHEELSIFLKEFLAQLEEKEDGY